MGAFSKLALSPLRLAFPGNGRIFNPTVIAKRNSGHGRVMVIKPSQHTYFRVKDHFMFYTAVGVGVYMAIWLYFEIFVGPAELRDIPEGYEPHWWEYEHHPITQVLCKYIWRNPQMEHEKMLHILQDENNKVTMRKLEERVRMLMFERTDYKAWHYQSVSAKWVEFEDWKTKQIFDNFEGFTHML